jgi:DNA-binding MarR family transcriptional regulator
MAEPMVPENASFLIAMVRRRLNLLFTAALHPYRVTPRQFGVLARLWRQDRLTVEELARQLYTDQSSLSRIIDRMVRDQLVLRRVDPRDRRARRIYLTPRGRALREPTEAAIAALETRMLDGLSAAETRRLRHDLVRLLDNLADEPAAVEPQRAVSR